MSVIKKFNYKKLRGVKAETIEKLSERKPTSLGHASRIAGISQDDLTILAIALKAV